MQRATLIYLRLMLASAIAVAVFAQLGSRVVTLVSPVGEINLAVYKFGIMVEFTYSPSSMFAFEFVTRRSHILDDGNEELFYFTAENVWLYRLTHSGIDGSMDFTQTVSLPGVVAGCGNGIAYDGYDGPSCFTLAHYVWILVPALLINFAAHWRVRRSSMRTKGQDPLTTS